MEDVNFCLMGKVNKGDIVLVYGQEAEIEECFVKFCFIKKPIVVPTIEYTRDYIFNDEIQKIITKKTEK